MPDEMHTGADQSTNDAGAAPQPPVEGATTEEYARWLIAMGNRLSLSKGLTSDGAALIRAGELLLAAAPDPARHIMRIEVVVEGDAATFRKEVSGPAWSINTVNAGLATLHIAAMQIAQECAGPLNVPVDQLFAAARRIAAAHVAAQEASKAPEVIVAPPGFRPPRLVRPTDN